MAPSGGRSCPGPREGHSKHARVVRISYTLSRDTTRASREALLRSRKILPLSAWIGMTALPQLLFMKNNWACLSAEPLEEDVSPEKFRNRSPYPVQELQSISCKSRAKEAKVGHRRVANDLRADEG